MVWTLIRRGLVVGVIAGLLAGVFAFVFGEPRVQDAIDIENAASAHASVGMLPLAHIGDWVVSRGEQRGGLFLATALYGIAAGGLFSIAFAVLRGRGSQRTDWELSTRLAAAIFVAIVLVPWLKYPPNPPAVGDPDTIGDRTAYYLVLLVGSALAMFAAARVDVVAEAAGAAVGAAAGRRRHVHRRRRRAGAGAARYPGGARDFPAPLHLGVPAQLAGHAGRAVGGARDRLRDRDVRARRPRGARRDGAASPVA